MRSTVEGKEPVRPAYFAAMNGRDGFTSFFEEIFFCDSIKKRYIIKGGPGTGKSSFTKEYTENSLEYDKQVACAKYGHCDWLD